MKRFLWLFMVTILLAACLATAGLAEGSSGTQGGATALTLDVPVALEITSGSDIALFSFTPTETGSYVFSSYSDGGGYDGLSTYGCLYDADMELLADNAYGGDDGCSFRILHVLEADTQYYFSARLWEGTGSFYVTLEKGELCSTTPDAQTLEVGYLDPLTLQVTAYSWAETPIQYQWYKAAPGGTSPRTALGGETSATLTLASVSEPARYTCEVTDGTDRLYFDFNVKIESDLTASAVGSTTIRVQPGGSATMSVTASCSIGDPSYQWYIPQYSSGSYSMVPAEGATEASYTLENVTRTSYVNCQVSDPYGNIVKVYFTVLLDNQLVAEEDTVTTTHRVVAGNSATLVVNASCAVGDPQYAWYYMPRGSSDVALEGELLEGQTGSVCTTDPITEDTNFCCEVTDSYGGYVTVWFEVELDNQLTAEPQSSTDVLVQPDGRTTLSVRASSYSGVHHYQWYKSVFHSDGTYDMVDISGATNASYTTESATHNMYYMCRVTDNHGGSADVYFSVTVDNQFTVSNPETDDVHMSPDERVTLGITASCRRGTISYQWQRADEVEGDGYQMVDIAGETTRFFTVQGPDIYPEYSCVVTDIYGNSITVHFVIKLNNQLTAEAVGSTSVFVPAGTSAELSVNATCNDGEIYYQWYFIHVDENSIVHYERIEGADDSTYAFVPTTLTDLFCRVTDDYEGHIDVSFSAGVDNQLEAYAPDDGNVLVEYGEPATLEVSASCLEGALTYQWLYIGEAQNGHSPMTEIEGATDPTFTIPAVTGRSRLFCQVTDIYRNGIVVEFNVNFDNHLTVTGAPEGDLVVEYGETATFELNATCARGSLHYQWNRWMPTGPGSFMVEEIEGATSASFTTPAVTEYMWYFCNVSDDYGNILSADCKVVFDNHFSAEADGSSEVTVLPGESVTLSVNAERDRGELHYQWSIWTHNTVNDTYGLEDIKGATQSSYTIPAADRTAEYYCHVQDDYGNKAYVQFDVLLDNQFIVTVPGSTSVSRRMNETATFEVSATCAVGELSYQWEIERKQDDGSYVYDVIEGADAPSYTTEPITDNAEYRCIISDEYDNVEHINFFVFFLNELQAEPVGDENPAISPDTCANLEVSASCSKGDIRYQWSRFDRIEDNTEVYVDIEGETGSTFTSEPLYAGNKFCCAVSDDYGSTIFIYFTVSIDNKLQASPAGDEWLNVHPGEDVTLKVNASCDIGTLAYQWYLQEHDPESGILTSTPIEGATQSEYTIEGVRHEADYFCRVTDQYSGKPKDVSFHVELDTGMQIEESESYLSVEPGERATLNVIASSEYSDLHYQWAIESIDEETDESTYNNIEGATGATYVTEPINGYEHYICRVSDDYGEEEYVYFYIEIDNALVAVAEQKRLYPHLGDAITLRVIAHCDNGALTYLWEEEYMDKEEDEWVYGEIEGAAGPTLTIDPVSHPGYYYCQVHDEYDNYEYVRFYVDIDNDLVAQAASETDFTVSPGDNVTLEVSASCSNGDPTYEWYVVNEYYDDGWDGTSLGEDFSGPVLALTNIQSSNDYVCLVSDQYGNTEEVRFLVRIDNQFSAAADSAQTFELTSGGQATLEVTADANAGDIHYDWYCGAEAIDDAHGSSYTTPPLTVYTQYSCTVYDDYGNSADIRFYCFVSDAEIHSGETLTLNNVEGRDTYVVFTPVSSGIYTLTSSTSSDPYCYVFDIDGHSIAYDDDSGSNLNFSVPCCLKAGEKYLFRIRYYEEEGTPATITVTLTQAQPDTTIPVAMRVGQRFSLPDRSRYDDHFYSLSTIDADIVSVSGSTFTAHAVGTTWLLANYQDVYFFYQITVYDDADVLRLPPAVQEIQAEAFEGDDSVRFVELGSSVSRIGKHAFRNSGLVQLVIPSRYTTLSVGAVSGTEAVIVCPRNSAAERYADNNRLTYFYLD